MTVERVPILWLTGPSGVGKTTLAREIHAMLGRRGVAVAHLDVDMIGLCYPAREDDPYPQRHALKARNLGALWPSYRDAGARCLVLAGGVEGPDLVRLYAERIPGAEITLCRLRLSAGEHRARLAERAGRSAAYADELVAETAELDTAGMDEVPADTGAMTVTQSAEHVLSLCGGWPGRAP